MFTYSTGLKLLSFKIFFFHFMVRVAFFAKIKLFPIFLNFIVGTPLVHDQDMSAKTAISKLESFIKTVIYRERKSNAFNSVRVFSNAAWFAISITMDINEQNKRELSIDLVSNTRSTINCVNPFIIINLLLI